MTHPDSERSRTPLRIGHICLIAVLAVSCSATRKSVPTDGRDVTIDAMRERILASLALRPGMTVADIGAGPGWFVGRVADAIGPQGVIYATDIDPSAITGLKKMHRPGSARVEPRLCRDERDTALDDLPDDHVDLILMIDSLCFDPSVSRTANVAYLSRFLRVLRPGGRLVHHMDCRCETSLEDVGGLFGTAGFSMQESVDVAPDAQSIDVGWVCRTDQQRRRHAWVGVFRKPEAISTSTKDGGSGTSWLSSPLKNAFRSSFDGLRTSGMLVAQGFLEA